MLIIIWQYHIKQLNLNGFNYVDNFSSNYIPTYLSLASTLGSSFPVTEKSEKYRNHSNFFPKFFKTIMKAASKYKPTINGTSLLATLLSAEFLRKSQLILN